MIMIQFLRDKVKWLLPFLNRMEWRFLHRSEMKEIIIRTFHDIYYLFVNIVCFIGQANTSKSTVYILLKQLYIIIAKPNIW